MLMRLVFVGLIVAAFYLLGEALGALLVPLVGSLVLAVLLDPFIRRLEERGLSRPSAILVSLSAGILVIGLIVLFLVPPLVERIGAIISELPTLIEQLQSEWVPWVEQRFGDVLPESWQRLFEGADGGGGEGLLALARRVGTWTLGAASTTSQALLRFFNFLLVPLFTYYFLRKLGAAKELLADLLPVRRREYTLELLGRMHRAVGEWFRGQLQVAAIVGLLYAVGLSIAFGVAGLDPMLGVAIGIVSGLTNIIPYLGFIIAAVLTLLVVLLDWPGWGGSLGIAFVFVVNNILESYVVGPKIMSESVGIHPIAVIILALVGAQLAGVVGVLLIIPLAGALLVIWPDLKELYRETTFYQGAGAEEGGEADTPSAG
jgi:predicted PurR-regulated permease PerM